MFKYFNYLPSRKNHKKTNGPFLRKILTGGQTDNSNFIGLGSSERQEYNKWPFLTMKHLKGKLTNHKNLFRIKSF